MLTVGCRLISEMETLKGAAKRVVCELQVLWAVLSFLVGMLVQWVLFRFPSIKERILADMEQQAQMQSFRGNWKVQRSTFGPQITIV